MNTSKLIFSALDGEVHDLKQNKKVIVPKDLLSLVTLFTPGVLFTLGLLVIFRHPDLPMLRVWSYAPWQLFVIALCGVVATVGGVADWIFHRCYVAAGPNERKSHLLAMGTGGFPLFFLMSLASLFPAQRSVLLIPIVVVLLYTTVIICYDEFIFHHRRCIPLETLFHRLLVFGNGCAFFAWFHWCFVAV